MTGGDLRRQGGSTMLQYVSLLMVATMTFASLSPRLSMTTECSVVSGKQRMQTVPRWGTLELTIANTQSYANPFMDVTLDATFTAPSGQQVKGLGFYDGGRHLVSVHALKASSETVQRAEWFAYHTVQDKLSDWNPMK